MFTTYRQRVDGGPSASWTSPKRSRGDDQLRVRRHPAALRPSRAKARGTRGGRDSVLCAESPPSLQSSPPFLQVSTSTFTGALEVRTSGQSPRAQARAYRPAQFEPPFGHPGPVGAFTAGPRAPHAGPEQKSPGCPNRRRHELLNHDFLTICV